MLIFDWHLDLAWNALEWNRDLTLPVATAELFDGLADPSEATCLIGAEIAAGRDCFPSGETGVERTLRMLHDAVEVAGRYFGPDHVRLVFAFMQVAGAVAHYRIDAKVPTRLHQSWITSGRFVGRLPLRGQPG